MIRLLARCGKSEVAAQREMKYIQRMLSRLPDHGIFIEFHITFIIESTQGRMFEVIHSQLGKAGILGWGLREKSWGRKKVDNSPRAPPKDFPCKMGQGKRIIKCECCARVSR